MTQFICYRCGTCCKGFNAIVPKEESSNLSPDYLNELERLHGNDYAMAYIRNNSVIQDKRCQWLHEEEDNTTTCLAYERRSPDCRNYPDYTLQSFCPVGKKLMERNDG